MKLAIIVATILGFILLIIGGAVHAFIVAKPSASYEPAQSAVGLPVPTH